MSPEKIPAEPAPATPKTVFVVGAGASYEVGLPVGDELTTEIGRLLNLEYPRGGGYPAGDSQQHIDRALRLIANSRPTGTRVPKELQDLHLTFDQLVTASVQISQGMQLTASIDNYLNSHQANPAIVVCGKVAIAFAILGKERKSKLKYVDPTNLYGRRINYEVCREAWYRSLFHILVADCRPEQLPKRLASVAFIIFNYDRCVEHYLYHALQTHYPSLDAEAAADLLRNVQFFHPYGKVGALPWQHEQPKVDFGDEPSTDQLLAIATQIRTFYEGVHATSGEALRRVVMETSKLIFLGFAFHPQNMDLLFDKASRHRGDTLKSVYGTAYKVASDDLRYINMQIRGTWKVEARKIHLDPEAKCAEIFGKHTRGISLL